MKTAIGLLFVAVFALFAAPAIASDTFHAFSNLSTMERSNFHPLGDDQLAAIEGALKLNLVVQVAVLNQINVCAVCKNVVLANSGVIVQPVRLR